MTMATIPVPYHHLLDQRTFAHLSRVMPDRTPHPTSGWIDHDAEADRLLVTTARGPRKERNVRWNPAVGLRTCDPEDPYRYVSARGEVAALTEDGAVEHIDELARRYMGLEEYPNHGEESGPRVILEIRPDRVDAQGD